MNLNREQRIYQIVLSAQEQDAAELNDYLEKVCAGDASLRNEVDQRLDAIHKVMVNVHRFENWCQGESKGDQA